MKRAGSLQPRESFNDVEREGVERANERRGLRCVVRGRDSTGIFETAAHLLRRFVSEQRQEFSGATPERKVRRCGAMTRVFPPLLRQTRARRPKGYGALYSHSIREVLHRRAL